MAQASLSLKASKLEVERYYDATAESYDDLYREEQYAKYRAAFKLLGNLKASTILDAGCGTGLLFSQLKGFKDLVGVDLSRQMLLKAKQKAASNPNIHLVKCDIEHLPFRSGVFNACFAFTVLQNLPNPRKALRELSRVLGEGAAVAVTLMDGAERLPASGEVLKLLGLRAALALRVRRERVLAGFTSPGKR
ncbi:MAG: class I SAM-dependent methyltransferase [Candidatus Hecatellaceae archaeon]